MTIKQLSNKIELSFWHVTINLLSDSHLLRETLRWVYCHIHKIENWEKIKQRLNLLIFGTSTLVTIIVVGMVSYFFLSVIEITTQKSITPATMPENGQRNILVIGVDDLNREKPKLAGIWLVVYFPENPDIIFAPIFPNPINRSGIDNAKLIDSFSLNKDDSPSRTFIEQLHQKHLYWHSYFVVDSYAVAETVKFIMNLGGNEQYSDKNPIDPIAWSDEISPSLNNQSDLLRNLCIQAKNIEDDIDFSRILNRINKHIYTDMDMISMIHDLRGLMSQESDLVCEFPIQRASNP